MSRFSEVAAKLITPITHGAAAVSALFLFFQLGGVYRDYLNEREARKLDHRLSILEVKIQAFVEREESRKSACDDFDATNAFTLNFIQDQLKYLQKKINEKP